MKKKVIDRNKRLVATILTISLLFLSSGLLFFKDITGNSILDNGVNQEYPCIDSDFKPDYYNYGEVSYREEIYSDKCIGNTLYEKYCKKSMFNDNYYPESIAFVCTYGCNNGKCSTKKF
ncbi:MAG: hypothetical protein WC867_04360 [Candidatus Pacearchaeota archaeon]|jgi:hypothetical protein